MQLTLGFLTLFAGAIDTINAAADAGFSSTGIRICPRRVGEEYPGILGDIDAIRNAGNLAADRGVRISNVSAFHFYDGVPFDELKRVVETTAELSCDTLIVNNYDKDKNRFIDIFTQYCSLAQQHGMRVAIEFVSHSAINSLPAALKIIKEVGAPNVGLLLDPLHLFRSGGCPDDIRSVDPDLIFLAQISDAPGTPPKTLDEIIQESRNGRLYLGEGGLNISEYFHALPAGIEIEAELPVTETRHLPLTERARLARVSTTGFLGALR